MDPEEKFDAALYGDLARVQQLVTKDNVEEVDEEGWTALHLACQGGHHHVAAWLVGLGAYVNVRDRTNGMTPLHWAATYSHPRCIELMLEFGADAGIGDDFGLLSLHCARMSAKCTELLIAAYPAGVNAVDTYGETPLQRAVRIGIFDVCSLLLDAGSKVDVVDNYGDPPLYRALRRGRRDLAELLLDRGAKLDRVNLDESRDESDEHEDEDEDDNDIDDDDDDANEHDEDEPDPLKAIPDWAVSFASRRNACRSSCWAMLELARRRSKVIGGNRRDVLWLVSRMVWDSRRDESWERNQRRKQPKRKVKK